MKEILLICFCFCSWINLFYFLIFLFDSFFGISLNDDFIKIQYKVNNQNKKIYVVGAVMHLYKKLKNIDFKKCTNIGAFVSMVHIGIVWGLIFGGATLLSLIISIIYTTVVNFKEKNYNLPSDEKFLNYCKNVKSNSIQHLYDCENNLLAYKNKSKLLKFLSHYHLPNIRIFNFFFYIVHASMFFIFFIKLFKKLFFAHSFNFSFLNINIVKNILKFL